MAPKWWPWQHKTRWILGPDIPEAYVKLNSVTDVWGPYKKKAAFLVIIGLSAIAMLDIPGLFFTNPYTHIVEGPAAYLGILGGIVVGVLGFLGMVAFQYFKDYETMQFTFGAFNLRVRKNYRCGFHALLGTIERIPDELADELKKVLDSRVDEIRQLLKVKPIDLQSPRDPKATNTTTLATQPAVETGIAHEARKQELHLFWIPLPGLPIPGIAHLSGAQWPEEIINPLPGEWIWEGWLRHAKGEVFDLATAGEWQFKDPAGNIVLVPITTAAGTHYDFTWGLERALKPPLIDQTTIEWAKNSTSARVVGLEALKQLQIYKDADDVRKEMEPTIREQVTDMVGGILTYLQAAGKMQPRDSGPKTRWGLVVGVGFLSAAVLAFGWLATHGWHI